MPLGACLSLIFIRTNLGAHDKSWLDRSPYSTAYVASHVFKTSTMPLENQKEEINCRIGLNLLIINAVNNWEHIHAWQYHWPTNILIALRSFGHHIHKEDNLESWRQKGIDLFVQNKLIFCKIWVLFHA
jgi:hypothetical protein